MTRSHHRSSTCRTLRRSTPILCIGLALEFACATPAATQQVTPGIKVSLTSNIESEPEVASHGDTLVGVWFSNARAGLGSGYSTDGGLHWGNGGTLPDILRGNEGRHTLCTDGQGRYYCLRRNSVADGWTVGVLQGVFNGSGLAWQELGTAIPSVSYGGDVDAIQAVCDGERHLLYVIYTEVQRFVSDSSSIITLIRSSDGGLTWSPPLGLSGNKCTAGRMALGFDGELWVVWEDFGAGEVMGRRSVTQGDTFQDPFVVAPLRDNVGTRSPGWIVDYYRRSTLYPLDFNTSQMDMPWIAVDRSAGPYRGRAYVTWTEYAAGVVLPAESFVGSVAGNDDLAHAQPVSIGADLFGNFSDDDFPPPVPNTVDYYVFEGTAGTTISVSADVFSSNYRGSIGFGLICEDSVGGFFELNGGDRFQLYAEAPFLYSLPHDGRYYLAVGKGSIAAVSYTLSLRRYEVAALQPARDHRDVVLAWSADGGTTWAPPVRVNDSPPGQDEAFPNLAVDGDGVVRVAWYDRRMSVECPEWVDTYAASSYDGGASFGAGQRLSTSSSIASDPRVVGWRVGDHLAVHAEGNRTWVLWTQIAHDSIDVYGARIADTSTPTLVSAMAASVEGRSVRVRWRLDITREARCIVYRSEVGEIESSVGEVEGDSRHEFEFEDAGVRAGHRYQYRVKLEFADGTSAWSEAVEVAIPGVATLLRIGPPQPNPSAGVVRFAIDVPRAGHLRAAVYDVVGRLRATLIDRDVPAGTTAVAWDGTSRPRPPGAGGVYYLRVEAHGERRVMPFARVP